MQCYQNTSSYENIVMEIFGGYETLEDITIHQKIKERKIMLKNFISHITNINTPSLGR